MSLLTLTEGAPTLACSGPLREELTSAERFARDRAELRSRDPAARRAAAVRLVESGSSAVLPLLSTVLEDTNNEVREAAMWALLLLTDDFLGENREEYDSIRRLLKARSVKDPYLNEGITAAWMRANGESAASGAVGRVFDLDGPSRQAALRFLEGLSRLPPGTDPEFSNVLRWLRWHPLPSVRRAGAEISRALAERVGTPDASEHGRYSAKLAQRRSSVAEEHVESLLQMMASDPDREVRYRCAGRLFHLLRSGASVPSGNVTLRDREVRSVFRLRSEKVEIDPNFVESVLAQFQRPSSRGKRCVLRLLAHLRAHMDEDAGEAVDRAVQEALRHKDREVRRDAIAVARLAGGDHVTEELAGRLRERLRVQKVVWVLATIHVSLFVLGLATRQYLLMGMAGALVGFTSNVYRLLTDARSLHRISDDEYLETLVAMEGIVDRSPEKLAGSSAELKSLAGKWGPPEVRAKARELLRKVHESSLDGLPISASQHHAEAVALPVPSAAPEAGEVAVR